MSIELRNQQNRPDRKPKVPAFLKIFSIVMAFVYAGFGIFILTSSEERLSLPGPFKIILGVMLIFYSFMRAYRAYQKYYSKPGNFRNKRDEELNQ